MIDRISIRNFKSLKNVSLECRRVNIIIGEPNVGKSNLLEALGVFALTWENYTKVLRYRTFYDLFFDTDVSEPVVITAGPYSMKIVVVHNEQCRFLVSDHSSISLPDMGGSALTDDLVLTLKPNGATAGSFFQLPFRYYRFAVRQNFSSEESAFLSVPDGGNLYSILRHNKPLRETVETILREKGYRLYLRTGDREIELVKDEGILISYPYQSISDTLQRIIFYLAAIESNRDAVLLLEEPEAHTFPFYTKFLAEHIALEQHNQYMIVTHNPYFLLSLIEKTPLPDLTVSVAYMENYETKLRPLTNEEITHILDLSTDVFFNLDTFIPLVP